MTDLKKYGNLNIKIERYRKILKTWKTYHGANPSVSFTEWVTKTMESALIKEKIADETYPKLRLIFTTEREPLIEDTEKNLLVKVFVKEGKIDCMGIGVEDRQKYVDFASLHPLFVIPS